MEGRDILKILGILGIALVAIGILLLIAGGMLVSAATVLAEYHHTWDNFSLMGIGVFFITLGRAYSYIDGKQSVHVSLPL